MTVRAFAGLDPETAVATELLAREQAWLRFLTEAQFSLEVWMLDARVRAGCEPPVAWLRRCSQELADLGRTGQ